MLRIAYRIKGGLARLQGKGPFGGAAGQGAEVRRHTGRENAGEGSQFQTGTPALAQPPHAVTSLLWQGGRGHSCSGFA